jgi:methyl coenzyme M reductase gamma subunit
METLSNSSGDRKQLLLTYQLQQVRHRRRRTRIKPNVWCNKSRSPNKKTIVVVGVEQPTENTEEIHPPMETDPELNEISRK